MDPHTARTVLAGGRAALGTLMLVTPRLAGKLAGIDPEDNPAAPYLARLFGARELFLAAPHLMPASSLDEAELASRAVPVDAADAVAAFAAGLKGYLPWRAAIPAAGAAVAAVYLGTVGSED